MSCKKLSLSGMVGFEAGVVVKGEVSFVNSAPERAVVKAGEYVDTVVDNLGGVISTII